MATDEGAERRRQRHRRISVQLPIVISTIDPEIDSETGKPYFRSSEETCLNVSRGGAYLVTPEPVAPGSRLLVELEIPGGRRVETIGRVAWSKIQLDSGGHEFRSGIGLEFLGGSPEDFAAIERYVSRLARPAPARRHPARRLPPTNPLAP